METQEDPKSDILLTPEQAIARNKAIAKACRRLDEIERDLITNDIDRPCPFYIDELQEDYQKEIYDILHESGLPIKLYKDQNWLDFLGEEMDLHPIEPLLRDLGVSVDYIKKQLLGLCFLEDLGKEDIEARASRLLRRLVYYKGEYRRCQVLNKCREGEREKLEREGKKLSEKSINILELANELHAKITDFRTALASIRDKIWDYSSRRFPNPEYQHNRETIARWISGLKNTTENDAFIAVCCEEDWINGEVLSSLEKITSYMDNFHRRIGPLPSLRAPGRPQNMERIALVERLVDLFNRLHLWGIDEVETKEIKEKRRKFVIEALRLVDNEVSNLTDKALNGILQKAGV